MKAYKNIILVVALVFAAGAGGGDSSVSTFTDKRDGKTYKIVKIGRQNWFAENLNYATEEGSVFGNVCYENKAENCAKYGRLYNWETALTACPAGTHLPTDKEWTTLVDYAGGEEKAGTKLKSSTGWKCYKELAAGTNDYGFFALPGSCDGGGVSKAGNKAGKCGNWWSATEDGDDAAWSYYTLCNYEGVDRNAYSKYALFSVRCVKD